MKYNLRLANYVKNTILRRLVNETHTKLTNKNYFSVFLNDTVSNEIQVTGLYEYKILIPLFEILTKKFDFKNSIAIDVGANIGNHTLFFSSIFQKVISFEPNPLTFFLLQANTFYFQNVEIKNIGLSDVSIDSNLSVPKGSSGGSSVVLDYNSGIDHRIKLYALDEISKGILFRIGLIKIDVEGFELKVLMGGINTIRKNLPIILFEQWHSLIVNGSSETFILLENEGYVMFILKESHYLNNKYLRLLKRLPLIITNGSLSYSLQKITKLEPFHYPMIIAIHKSHINFN